VARAAIQQFTIVGTTILSLDEQGIDVVCEGIEFRLEREPVGDSETNSSIGYYGRFEAKASRFSAGMKPT